MPMPQAETSAFGNGPKDINSPVPTDQSGPQAQASAPTPSAGALPPLPPSKAQPEGRQAESNPFDTPLKQDERSQLDKIKSGIANPFDEKDPNFPTGYIALTPRLRRNPSGQIEVLRNGQWGAPTQGETQVLDQFASVVKTWGLRAKEDLPRFFGSLFGAALGEGVAGPYGAIAGSGLGQAAAGAAANYAEGKPNTLGSVIGDTATGAAAMAIPTGAGKFLAGQAAQYGAEAAMSPMVKAGADILTQRAEARLNAANDLGVTLRPDQVNPENISINKQIQAIMQKGGAESQKLAQIQALQKSMLLEKRDALIDKLQGPYKGELGDQNTNFANVFGTILQNHENAIASLKEKAFSASGNEAYDMDPLLSKMRETISDRLKHNVFSDNGRIDATLLSDVKELYGQLPDNSRKLVGDYIRLQNATLTGRGLNEVGAFKNSTPADRALEPIARQSESSISQGQETDLPKLKPGLTLPEMEVFRKDFGNEANFGKTAPRDEVERAYGDLYYTLRTHMDSKMIDAFKKIDPSVDPMAPQYAAKLMAHKDFYSTFKEDAVDFQRKVEYDPTNAAQALIDIKDPEKARSLTALLDDKQKNYLAGGLLENITLPLMDETTGKMKTTSVANSWNKIDPKVKDIFFGEDTKKIDSLITVSKAIEAKDLSKYDPTTDPLTQRALGAIKSIKAEGGLDFISKLFSGNPKARDYLAGEAADVLMPTGQDTASLAKRQILMNHSSKVLLSKPVRYGSQFLGADLMSPNPQPQQEMGK